MAAVEKATTIRCLVGCIEPYRPSVDVLFWRPSKSEPVTNAVVSVNGANLEQVNKSYSGTLNLERGAQFKLSVTLGDVTYTNMGVTIAKAPEITAPLNGDKLSASQVNYVTFQFGSEQPISHYFRVTYPSDGSRNARSASESPMEIPKTLAESQPRHGAVDYKHKIG